MEIPAQGHGPGPDHRRVGHPHLCHGVGQVDHYHPHATRSCIRAVVPVVKLLGDDVQHTLVGHAGLQGCDVD